MTNDAFWSKKLEKYHTRSITDKHINGSLTVIWRDWDDILKTPPKMVYVTSALPGEIKGPHIHTRRNSYFTCINGKVIFIIKDKKGNYHEVESSEENPVMIYVPKNLASAHINISKNNSIVLTLADLAWRPDDEEMINVSFDGYNWEKWKSSNL